MKAVFRHEAKQYGNGATLFRWELQTDDGAVIDESLATEPTVQGDEIYFVTSENVDRIDAVTPVAQLGEMQRGKPLTLYKIAARNCNMSANLPGAAAR